MTLRTRIALLMSLFAVIAAAFIMPQDGGTKPTLVAADTAVTTTIACAPAECVDPSPPTTTQFTKTVVSLAEKLNKALQPTTTTTAPPKKVAPKQPRVIAANVNQPVHLPTTPSETSRAIHEAAIEFGVSELTMFSIAKCESTFLTNSDNGGHSGLFQQSEEYWPGRVEDFNKANDPDVLGNIYSPFDNARVSAWMMAAPGGIERHWKACI